MGFFDEIRRRFLKSSGNTLWQEVIKRPDKERKNQAHWAQHIPDVLATLSQSYHYKKADLKAPWQVHLFDSSSANGFALSYPRELGKLGFQHLFDLLKDQVLRMDYRLANSDRRFSDKGSHVTTTEKHYLKPPLGTLEPPIDQHYGNVLIELIKEDDEPRYIKVLVSIYNDRHYQTARPFHEFLDQLFAPPPTTKE